MFAAAGRVREIGETILAHGTTANAGARARRPPRWHPQHKLRGHSIAVLPNIPALRREQIKLQLALITPVMHRKGLPAPETKTVAECARLLTAQTQALGERTRCRWSLCGTACGWPISPPSMRRGVRACDPISSAHEKPGAKVPLMVGRRRVTTVSPEP